MGRFTTRRDRLLERLAAAVDEIATVYAGLLELSATARTIGVWVQDREIGAVNDSITLLQMTFAELEADAAKRPKAWSNATRSSFSESDLADPLPGEAELFRQTRESHFE